MIDLGACHFCGQTGTRIEGNHWTGTEYVRVPVCSDDFSKLAKAPRKPRKPRQPAPLPATDWNMLVAFSNGRKRYQ
jgi:hypothetical protein